MLQCHACNNHEVIKKKKDEKAWKPSRRPLASQAQCQKALPSIHLSLTPSHRRFKPNQSTNPGQEGNTHHGISVNIWCFQVGRHATGGTDTDAHSGLRVQRRELVARAPCLSFQIQPGRQGSISSRPVLVLYISVSLSVLYVVYIFLHSTRRDALDSNTEWYLLRY